MILPTLKGLIIGFCGLLLLYKLGQTIHPATAAGKSEEIEQESRRVVLMLTGRENNQVAGLWQWDSNTGACIASLDYIVSPTGKELGDLLQAAASAGDDQWIARHARSLPSDCGPAGESTVIQVVLISGEGLADLVDSLDGLEIDEQQMDGRQVWEYLVDGSVDIYERSIHQYNVWMALGDKIKHDPKSVHLLKDKDSHFWSDSTTDSAIDLVKQVVSYTPQSITP